ncbi:MAG: lipoyl(octanoyl) transferase LipB [Gammaproteobacteria bacterium]|jgi:lipoyl(octanoyl) transferase|nr:lipoyl(octanoyl) transferase LipB [Gammaproteobacteria bacterium]
MSSSHSEVLKNLLTGQLRLRRLGIADYERVWREMQDFTDSRDESSGDELWLVQHPPVFTQGQAGKAEHVLAPGDIPVIQVDRGGQVTYHGPGQIVAYPLVDIRRKGITVREFVRCIEESIIQVLAQYSVKGERIEGAPGIYVAGDKVASLGLRVRRGCTFHGLAFNIDMDLEPFQRINPCGYAGLQVTQLSAWATASLAEVEERLIKSLAGQLGYSEIREIVAQQVQAIEPD